MAPALITSFQLQLGNQRINIANMWWSFQDSYVWLNISKFRVNAILLYFSALSVKPEMVDKISDTAKLNQGVVEWNIKWICPNSFMID